MTDWEIGVVETQNTDIERRITETRESIISLCRIREKMINRPWIENKEWTLEDISSKILSLENDITSLR